MSLAECQPEGLPRRRHWISSALSLRRWLPSSADPAPRVLRSVSACKQIPVLETPHGPVYESNAICRYIAGRSNKGLYPTAVHGGSDVRAAIDGWIDWTAGLDARLNDVGAPLWRGLHAGTDEKEAKKVPSPTVRVCIDVDTASARPVAVRSSLKPEEFAGCARTTSAQLIRV